MGSYWMAFMIAEPDEDDEGIDGESSEEDDVVPNVSYNVTSYGSDPEVESLVNRLRRGDVIIPAFQRDYVWRQPDASKFIESLLLGLPVPGLFFAVDPDTSQQLVIDGQQRLKTLQFFYDGYFNPKPTSKTQKVFSLVKVQKAFEGLTYKTLRENDRIRLDTVSSTRLQLNRHPPSATTPVFIIFSNASIVGGGV